MLFWSLVSWGFIILYHSAGNFMGTSTEKFMPFILDNFCVLFCIILFSSPSIFSVLSTRTPIFFSLFYFLPSSVIPPIPSSRGLLLFWILNFLNYYSNFFLSFFILLSSLSEKFSQLIFSQLFWVFPRTLFVLFDFVFIVSLFESNYPILTTSCMVSSILWHFHWQCL